MNVSKLFRTLLLIASFFSFSAYATQDKIPNNSNKLIGKTFEYTYGDVVYHVNFKSANTLHWKAIKGEEAGREDDETYTIQQLSSTTYFIAWIEKDGLGVSQVLNLKDKKINAFLKIDKEIIPLTGSARELY